MKCGWCKAHNLQIAEWCTGIARQELVQQGELVAGNLLVWLYVGYSTWPDRRIDYFFFSITLTGLNVVPTAD